MNKITKNIKEEKELDPIPSTSSSNIDNSVKTDINLMKTRIEQLGCKLFPQDDPKKSYLYLKGFYDATYQFMQTFNKILDLGVLNGTKTNTNN